ncbi:PREDICTED: uncharacterized protein LOC109205880 [Nicotiana attenuata]|uniref:uncharacterized protein LOC109205880 n=1 Tax=Nicotiana attenuata TaxID=49451 RepID=UPI0009047889|nr:PREDICTED: uncharacterized protein LOC109205880 [Nicotiana attenuata]
MEASKLIDTPIATATRLDMAESSSPVNQTMYISIIGSLLYLTASWPNIVFSVGLSARFQSNPKESHLKPPAVLSFYGSNNNWKILECTLTVCLFCDNTSALNMAKNPVQHKITKHIDVRHHFLRDNVEKGFICMKFCSTEDRIADIFIKALSKEHFERNRLHWG